MRRHDCCSCRQHCSSPSLQSYHKCINMRPFIVFPVVSTLLQAALAQRTYFVDGSCNAEVSEAIREGIEDLAAEATNRINDDALNTILGYIYPGMNAGQKTSLFGACKSQTDQSCILPLTVSRRHWRHTGPHQGRHVRRRQRRLLLRRRRPLAPPQCPGRVP